MSTITPQCTGVTQSNILENCVREQRQGEMNKNLKMKMSGYRCWHNLISGKIEQTDVDHEAPGGMKDRNIDGLIVARPQKVPQRYTDIASTKTQATKTSVLLLRSDSGEDRLIASLVTTFFFFARVS